MLVVCDVILSLVEINYVSSMWCNFIIGGGLGARLTKRRAFACDSHSGLATTPLVMEVAPENRMGCILLTMLLDRVQKFCIKIEELVQYPISIIWHDILTREAYWSKPEWVPPKIHACKVRKCLVCVDCEHQSWHVHGHVTLLQLMMC